MHEDTLVCSSLHVMLLRAVPATVPQEQERAAKQAETLAQVLEGAKGESALIDELRKEQVCERA